MYTLTLSKEERAAIDWVGGRDWNGHDLYLWLWGCEQTPDDADWDDPRPILFLVPEHKAWLITDKIESEGVPHFAPELEAKLREFADSVV